MPGAYNAHGSFLSKSCATWCVRAGARYDRLTDNILFRPGVWRVASFRAVRISRQTKAPGQRPLPHADDAVLRQVQATSPSLPILRSPERSRQVNFSPVVAELGVRINSAGP